MGCDAINRPYPQAVIEPNEPNLSAGYAPHCDGELAAWGRVINRAATGAVYDLATRVGTPIVGQGGGILATAGSLWRYAGTIPVGNVNFSYTADMQIDVAGPAWTMWIRNGGHYIAITGAGGDRPYCAFDAGGTIAGPAYSVVGRGPVRWDALYDGANEIPVVNGRAGAGVAVAPNIGGAATVDVGGVGTVRLFKVYNTRRTVAEARASYVREFAKVVVYAWKPQNCGEGPAGGIPTGAVGEGDWFAPLGGATLQFVWRPDLSLPGGGRLALTDGGALSLRRLAFMHPRAPLFGSWRFRFELRDPATDNPRFAFTALRDTDFTGAGSASTWCQVQRAAGVMNLTLHYANGAAALTVNHTAAGAAGDWCDVLVTHHPSGDWRAWLAVNGVWAGDEATVWNDVAQLSSNQVIIVPRQSYVTNFVRMQGEVTPHEGGFAAL